MVGSPETKSQVPAVFHPSAELPSPVVVVPKPPARSRRLVPHTVIPRRIGTRAHPVADAPPPVPFPAEIVPIAVVFHPRQLPADSFDDYDEDSEDDRPVNSWALLRVAERARNSVPKVFSQAEVKTPNCRYVANVNDVMLNPLVF